jgi:hypothetical protein
MEIFVQNTLALKSIAINILPPFKEGSLVIFWGQFCDVAKLAIDHGKIEQNFWYKPDMKVLKY